MKKQTGNISLIVPTHNEERIVKKNLLLIYNYLNSDRFFRNFEILVCDYSKDKTPDIVKSLSKKYSRLKYIEIKYRGIGIAIRKGIESARYDAIMVYPIDMTWDKKCIKHSIMGLSSSDIVLGSRSHKDSVVTRPFKRRVFSKLYNLLINLFFGLGIKDTQCTIALRKGDVRLFIKKLRSHDASFQIEVLIHAKKQKLKIVEIPVVVRDTRTDSKIHPLKDGLLMFRQVFKIRRELKK